MSENSKRNSLVGVRDISVEISIGGNTSSILVPGTANEIKGLLVYGLSIERAQQIVSQEIFLSFPYYDIGNTELVSLTLLEIFGEQFIEEALELSYYFMDNYALFPEEYLSILYELIKTKKAEQLMVDSSIIKSAIEKYKYDIEEAEQNLEEDNENEEHDTEE